MSEKILREHRVTWDKKPALRAIYEDFYRRVIAAYKPGLSLEIGGGSGNLKEFVPHVVSTDIVCTPWLDVVADAQALPFAPGTFANVIAVDVLHHIERPRRFLVEAQRVLRVGGRIILLEPAITPVSWVFYRFFHSESVAFDADPLEDGPVSLGREPFDANQAVATLLFGRYRQQMDRLFPDLKLVQLEWLSFFAYPLSGGFRPWCLIPRACVGSLLKFERGIATILGRLMAFRRLIIIEKVAVEADLACP